MDKLWLRVLEGIFGESLLDLPRFSVAEPDASYLPLQPDVKDALRDADAQELEAVDKVLRAMFKMPITAAPKKSATPKPEKRRRRTRGA